MMDLDRARELTRGCVASSVSVILGPEYVPLPEASLEELLEANRIVGENREIAHADGSRTIQVTVDPRGVALHYAYEHYGRDPLALCQALGYYATESDYDD